MSKNEQLIDTLKTILHERFAIDASQLVHASRLSDMGIDSLHVVDVMLDMEEAFDFRYDALSLPVNPSLEEIADAILACSGKPE